MKTLYFKAKRCEKQKQRTRRDRRDMKQRKKKKIGAGSAKYQIRIEGEQKKGLR